MIDFEHLCDQLAGFEPGIVSTDLKRTGGVAQCGADVEGFDDRHRPVLGPSARRYQKVTPAKLRTWVDDFVGEWDSHWRRRGVEEFVIAVTVETNRAYADGREAKTGIAAWIAFYNTERFHQALGNQTPMRVWRDGTAAAAASDPGLWRRWTTLPR